MKIKYYVIFSIIVIIILFRIALPYIATSYINNQLNRDPNYSIHVHNVDIAILARSINLKNIEIKPKNYPEKIPLFKADSIKIFLQFFPLLIGKLVMDIKVGQPEFNYLVGPPLFLEKSAMPEIELKKLAITNGKVNIINLQGNQPYKIYVNDINFNLNQIANSKVYEINIQAVVMDSGNFNLTGKLIPFKNDPYFYITSSLKSLDIPKLNDVLKHYTDIKVTQGKFSLFVEISSKNNIISGYAKPFIKDLAVEEKDKNNNIHKIYKNIVELGTKILKNSDQDTIATKIKIYGKVEDPNVSNFSIITYLMRHAFIQALIPRIDHQFSGKDVNYNEKNNDGDKK